MEGKRIKTILVFGSATFFFGCGNVEDDAGPKAASMRKLAWARELPSLQLGLHVGI